MPDSKGDRALRRLVADLANRGEHEIEAVLNLLEPANKADVRRLLDVYKGEHLPDVEAGPMIDAAAQAPSWVLERIDANGGIAISATAREALRSCLADWRSPEKPFAPASGRGPSLLSRARSALSFARAPR